MVIIMHDGSTNASNVVIPPTQNGTAPSIPVKPATKSHPDTHHKHVEDVFTMMESMAIPILKESMMETSLESVDFHMFFLCFALFVCC
jgi:hypothetical protein